MMRDLIRKTYAACHDAKGYSTDPTFTKEFTKVTGRDLGEVAACAFCGTAWPAPGSPCAQR